LVEKKQKLKSEEKLGAQSSDPYLPKFAPPRNIDQKDDGTIPLDFFSNTGHRIKWDELLPIHFTRYLIQNVRPKVDRKSNYLVHELNQMTQTKSGGKKGT
jgi:hypothetical protein